MIEFTVLGEPTAQARPRFTTRGGFPRAYDTDKSRDYKALVASVASQHRPQEPLTGPLHLELTIYRGIPKSWSKKKRQEALEGRIRPTSKPDIDNYIKIACDGLNGLLWRDDAQIVSVEATKFYSDNPRIVVRVLEL